MNFLELATTRRTIHQYEPALFDDACLTDLLEAAHHAPCHKVTWPWRFNIIGPQTRAKIAQRAVEIKSEAIKSQHSPLSEAATLKIKAKILDPGALIIVSQIKDEDPFRTKEDYAATACAIQNLMLAAHEKELGAKWSTGAITTDATTYSLTKIDPESEEIVGFIWVGQAHTVPIIKRPPVAEVTRKLP